jgi:hypothetical protein
MNELDPFDPGYYRTKENIVRLTEDLLDPETIKAAEASLNEIEEEHPDQIDRINLCREAIRKTAINLMGGYDAQVQFYDDINWGGGTYVWVLFINYRSKKADLRLYRNRAAAKGQTTKFFRSVQRLAGKPGAFMKVKEGRQ